MAGFPDQQYGQNKKGPVAPTFDHLSKHDKTIAVNATLKLFGVDILPVTLKPGGRLHAMLLACGAALLMRYPDRFRDGELSELLTKMRTVYGEEKNGASTRSSSMTRVNHETMIRWGKLIKANFQKDNLHLTTFNFNQKNQMNKQLTSVIRALTTEVRYLKQQNEILMEKIQELQISSAQIHERVIPSVQKSTDKSVNDVASPSIQSGHLSTGFGSPMKRKKSLGSKLGLVYTSKKEKTQLVRLSSFPTSRAFYLSIAQKTFNIHSLKKQDKQRANWIIKHFDCFTTEKEQKLLIDKNTDDKKLNDIVKYISKIIIHYYRSVYDRHKKKLPPLPKVLQQTDDPRIKTTALETLRTVIKKHTNIVINPTPAPFMRFRKQFEEKQKSNTDIDSNSEQQNPIHLV